MTNLGQLINISNWNFFPIQTREKNQLDISNWRMSKIPMIAVQEVSAYDFNLLYK